jgi:hypothetical protein
MRLHGIIAAAILATLWPASASAGEANADSAAAGRFSFPTPRLYSPPDHFLRDGVDASSPGYLNLSLGVSSLPWYAPPTRFDAVLQGAGHAATVGMFLGAIGNTLGWFDEETTWWLTGSLAAAGAVYAGARYEPQPVLRLKWSPGDDD